MKLFEKIKKLKNDENTSMLVIYYTFSIPLIGLISIIFLLFGLTANIFGSFMIGFLIGFSIICALTSLIISIIALIHQRTEKILSVFSVSISVIYILMFIIIFTYFL